MEDKTTDASSARRELENKLGVEWNTIISEVHALNVRTAAIFDTTLQPAAFLIVRWLLSHGGSNAKMITEGVAMDRSSVSRLIRQLKSSGYLEMTTNKNDYRGKLYSLSALGEEKLIAVLKEKQSIFYERISALHDDDLKSYIQMLTYLSGK